MHSMPKRAEQTWRFRPPTPREQAWIRSQWEAEIDQMPAPKGHAVRLIAIVLIAISTVYLIRQPTEIFPVGAITVVAAFMLLLANMSRKNAKLKLRLQEALRQGDYLVAEVVPTKIWMYQNGRFKKPMVTLGSLQTHEREDYRLPLQYAQRILDQNVQGIPVLVLQITGASRKLAVFRDHF